MSASPEQRIRRAIEAFNRRDWDAVARGLPEHFEFHDNVPPDGLVERGPGAVEAITTASGDAAFADLAMEVREVRVLESTADPEQILVRLGASAAGGQSAVSVSSELGQLWTLVDGRPIKIEQFRSWGEAERAAQHTG